MECLWCADVFDTKFTYYHDDGFCSKDCYQAFQDSSLCSQETKKHDLKILDSKICVICGSVFNGKDAFCSGECSIKYCEANNIFYQKVDIHFKCKQCGKFFKMKHSKHQMFCNTECKSSYYSGENHPNYKNGSSPKYCSKWNKNLRNRVRAFFGNKCFICGKSQEDEGRALAVHHVNYDKNSCCNDKPRLFVPLCGPCHAKTNLNRKYWETLLENELKEKYNYKCYFEKTEFLSIKFNVYKNNNEMGRKTYTKNDFYDDLDIIFT